MIDPVVDPEGNSFERSAIEDWVRNAGHSPITRTPLALHQLVPNRALRDMIEAWRQPPQEQPDEGQVSPTPRVCERTRLEEAKRLAISNEDYDLAKQLKAEIAALVAQEAQVDFSAHIASLEQEKDRAVADEDFDRAKHLKQEIATLRQTVRPTDVASEAELFDLGAGLGVLLRVAPHMPAEPAPRPHPLPVVVLDRSLSMGGIAKWVTSTAVPGALSRLGYRDEDRCVLVTFDSRAERVRAPSGRRGRAVAGGDPTLRELRGLDMSVRGTTTLLAPAVQVLADALRQRAGDGTACNVFVISDGHVMDLPLVRTRADTAAREGTSFGRVSFALFRFFNGEAPDTAALAALASAGTAGPAPCVDCYPPTQWPCPQCTYLNPVAESACELCGARGLVPTEPGTVEEDNALNTFISTACEAFATSASPHARVSAGIRLRRLPCRAVPHGCSDEEVPYGGEAYFVLDEALKEVCIDGRRVVVTPGTLPPCSTEQGPLAAFSESCLAQLRLWLVGGTRSDEFAEVVGWFCRLAEVQAQRHGDGRVGDDVGALTRAHALCHRMEGNESALGRICSLAEAGGLVAELSSKQQGDFLRGASAARADRLLGRRALGSDIVYHDACRKAIAEARERIKEPPQNAGAATREGCMAEEQHLVSYYGGASYQDLLLAARVLSGCAQDLSTADILKVVGGLGAPFSADELAHPDDVWELQITRIDAGVFLSESDIWAAAVAGETLRCGPNAVNGVVPLAECGAVAHETYERDFFSIGLLHLGAQLRGVLPIKPWGWEPHRPPWRLEVARGVRESAALRCAVRDFVGPTRTPSLQEATLLASLAEQLHGRSEEMRGDPAVAAALEALWSVVGTTQPDAPAPYFVAALLPLPSGRPCGGIVPLTARVLYWVEVKEAARKILHRDPSYKMPQHAFARRETVFRLLAADPDQQRVSVTEAQVLERTRARLDGDNPDDPDSEVGADALEVDNTIAGAAELALRLQSVEWLPSPSAVLGLCRIAEVVGGGAAPSAAERIRACTPLSQSKAWFGHDERDGSADAGVFFAAVAAAMAMSDDYVPPPPHELVSVGAARRSLRKLLSHALRNDHELRLTAEATVRVLDHRAEAQRRLHERAARGSGHSEPRADAKLETGLREASSVRCPKRAFSHNEHVSVVLCGHSGGGKSTIAGRLLFDLGQISPYQMQRQREEAERLGRSSLMFAYAMDRSRCERLRGLSVMLSKARFFTERWFCSLIDVPGHIDFCSAAMNGISQGDVGVLVVPGDEDFQVALARGSHAEGIPQGQTRHHARLLNLAGVRQFVVLVNKMDSGVAGFRQEHFEAIQTEVRHCLIQVGVKKDLVERGVPILPVSAWTGENIVRGSDSMSWWQGHTIDVRGRRVVARTFVQTINDFVQPPERVRDQPLRVPVSGVFRILGVGDVVTGRVEQGTVKCGDTLCFIPAHTGSNPCTGKVCSIETHHERLDDATAGDIVGLNVKHLKSKPRIGDVMVLSGDASLACVDYFTAQVQVLDPPGELKVGYSPTCWVRTGRAHVRIQKIAWKMGSRTGGKKMEAPDTLRRNEMAEVSFQVMEPLTLDCFKTCEGLARVAFFDHGVCIMLGKVVSIEPAARCR